MHIIITLAGHSRRFKEAGYNTPKFLVPLNGAPMISHVVNMFDQNDTFHFVLNRDQEIAHPSISKLLRSLAKKTTITVIPPHENGPVDSALQVNIPDNEPIIISYCDFYVTWNYPHFLRTVYSYDGAIPSFKGFHPASFGQTHYAYMRLNERNELLELREKKSFTDQRHLEPASAGIYYFKTFSLFKKYTSKIANTDRGVLNENYVSLLYNPMVRDNLNILVTPVKNFICWGTPEDVSQYQFWLTYFSKKQEKYTEIPNQTNLIPMAGKGSRFKNAGYKVCKPLIQVANKTMARRACQSFPPAQKWIFLVNQPELEKHPIKNELLSINKNSSIVPVYQHTQGQAITCLLARHDIADAAPLFIASCDYEMHYNHSKFLQLTSNSSVDVVIFTYKLKSMLSKNPKAFAYCDVNTDNQTVTRIVEKNTISDHPEEDHVIVGSFWFRRGRDFITAANHAIEHNITVNNEYYIGNSLNYLIQIGMRIVTYEIDQWISFGDPFELDIYNYWEEFFCAHEQPLVPA